MSRHCVKYIIPSVLSNARTLAPSRGGAYSVVLICQDLARGCEKEEIREARRLRI
jgi:hypothetical protein